MRLRALGNSILIALVTLGLLELVLRAIILIIDTPVFATIPALHRYRAAYSTEGLVMRGLLSDQETTRAEEDLMYPKHPTRGWSVKSNLDTWIEGYRYTTNSHGHRGAGEPDMTKPRVMLLGNSQTFGDEVDDVFVLSHLAQQHLPAVSIVNLGVSGYGFDQMYITFNEEYQKWRPRYVVFLVMSDDFYRVAYRHMKPFFRIEIPGGTPDRVTLIQEAPSDAAAGEVKRSWRYYLRHFAIANVSRNLMDRVHQRRHSWPQSEIAVKEMMRLVLETTRGESVVGLIYLSFNNDEESTRNEAGSAPFKLYSDLCTKFASQGLLCADTLNARRQAKGLRTSKGHYYRLGNEIAARELVKLLSPH